MGEIHSSLSQTIMDETKLKSFNNRLRDLYGLYYDGKPLYRLVWSDSQIEKRFGTWEIWSGQIFIREFTGVHEAPKYPWIKNRWILERREGHIPNPELAEQIEYEPKWVFQNETEAVEPEWWAIEQIIHAIQNPRGPRDINNEKSLIGSPANVDKQKERMKDFLDDQMSDVQTALQYGEGIVVPEIKNNGATE